MVFTTSSRTSGVASDAPGPEMPGTDDVPHRLRILLDAIVVDTDCHVRWLHTLSMLELMGTRKIARTLVPALATETMLRHLAEEARHAHFFKRMAARVAGAAHDGGDVLCGGAAVRYFQSLDARVRTTLPAVSTGLWYLCTTTLIEERAGLVYPIYDDILRAHDVPVRLRGLIGEESGHLSEMYAMLASAYGDALPAATLTDLRAFESTAFRRFLRALELAVPGVSPD